MSANDETGGRHASAAHPSRADAAAADRRSLPGSLGRAALQLSRSYLAYLDAAAEPYGISGAHVPLLVYLVEHGDGHTQNDIARSARLDKGTVSRRIAQLVRFGLVSQTTSERDSRAHRVALTNKGRALAGPVAEIPRRWDDEVASSLIADSRARLHDELDALNARAERLLGEVATERDGRSR